MARRPRIVRQQMGRAPDDASAGPLKVISLRAGDGRDLLHVPAGHPRRHDVRARLVELDPRNAGAASDPARRRTRRGAEAVKGDASLLVWTGTSAHPTECR
jgi:hypothetical protein